MKMNLLFALVLSFSTMYGAHRVNRAELGDDTRDDEQTDPARGPVLTDEGEILLDTVFHYGPASGSQYTPMAAFDGANFLVVWRSSGMIMASRLSADGVLLDSLSFRLGSGVLPAAAFDGTNFLVVWDAGLAMQGARVTPAGALLDSLPINFSPPGSGADCPRVATDGSSFLAVWEAGSNIYGARVSDSGVLLDSAGIPICVQAASDQTPDVAFNGLSYLVAWSAGHDVQAARVSPAGELLDSLPIGLSPSAFSEDNPAVVGSAGSVWLVAWTDRRADYDVYGTRVAADGTVLDSAGIPIAVVSYSRQNFPRLAFNGTDYAAVWEDRRNGVRDIYGARVTVDGVLLDSAGIPVCLARSSQYYPGIASDGSRCLAVWEDRRAGSRDIYGARIAASGSVLDSNGILASLSVSTQALPATAYDGTNYLTVWQDNRDGFRRVYGARLTTGGTVLDPDGFAVRSLNADQLQPKVAFDGTNYLVTWIDGRGNWIYATRVAPDGHCLDSLGFPVSDTLAFPLIDYHSLAFDGTNYLAVWHDMDTIDALLGARITPEGSVLDTCRIVVSSPLNEPPYAPAVSAGTSGWLVAWTGSDTSSDDAVLAARVSPDGVVLDSLGIPLMIIEASDYFPPAVAFDGTNFLVAWESWYADTLTEYDAVFGARVSQTGQKLDSAPFVITAGEYDHYYPALGFNGSDFIAAWEDDRYGADLFGARISPSGAVLDSFAISTMAGTQTSPSLTHGPNSDMMLAFEGYVDSVNGRFFGVSRIWSKLEPLAGIAERNPVSASALSAFTAFPNPTHGVTVFRLPPSANRIPCVLSIFDATGRLVRNLRSADGGKRLAVWDGRDNSGQRLGNGVYYCRLTGTNSPGVTCSMILLR